MLGGALCSAEWPPEQRQIRIHCDFPKHALCIYTCRCRNVALYVGIIKEAVGTRVWGLDAYVIMYIVLLIYY